MVVIQSVYHLTAWMYPLPVIPASEYENIVLGNHLKHVHLALLPVPSMQNCIMRWWKQTLISKRAGIGADLPKLHNETINKNPKNKLSFISFLTGDLLGNEFCCWWAAYNEIDECLQGKFVRFIRSQMICVELRRFNVM